MKWRLAAVVAVALAVLPCPARAAETGFSDVAPDAWYAPYVEVCVAAGLMNGVDNGKFAPEQELTTAECLLLAVRLHQKVNGLAPATAPEGWGTLTITDQAGKPRFSRTDFRGYAVSRGQLTIALPRAEVETVAGQAGRLILHGDQVYPGRYVVAEDDLQTGLWVDPEGVESVWDITDAFPLAAEVEQAPAWARDGLYYVWRENLSLGYSRPATDFPASRLDFLASLEEIVDPATLPELNQIDCLPDIPVNAGGYATDGDRRYSMGNLDAFYRAGVLSGVDAYGTFHAGGVLTRAEAAAVLARLLRPGLRMTFTLTPWPWETEYELTDLGLDAEDWWLDDMNWLWPNLVEYPPEGQLLRLSRRTAEGVAYDDSGIFTLDGQWLAEPGRYGEISDFSADGLAVAATSFDWYNAKYGVIDSTGKEVLPPIYDGVAPVHDGLLIAEKDGAYLLFDAQGQAVGLLSDQSGEVSRVEGVREGRVLYENEQGLYGFLALDGGVAVPARYEGAEPFSQGLAAVTLDGKVGFIDQGGDVVIPFQFEPVSGGGFYQFRGGTAVVQQEQEVFLIDQTGRQVTPHRYHYFNQLSPETALYQFWDGETGDEGIVSLADGAETSWHWPEGCQIMADCGSCFLVQWNLSGSYNYMDRDGNMLLPVWFSAASPLTGDGQAAVQWEDGYYRLTLQ